MDPDSTASIIIVALLALHIFFAAAKEAIVSMRRSRRLQLIEAGSQSAQLVDDLAEDIPRLTATEQLILRSISLIILALAIWNYTPTLSAFLSIQEWLAASLITLLTIAIILIFGDLLPREFARQHADPLALWVIYPLHILARLGEPLAQGIILVSRLAQSKTEDYNQQTLTEEDLLTYVEAGEEEGLLEEDVKEMIYSLFDLADTLAREVMVPRVDVVALQADSSLKEALDIILEAGHSRIPVFEDDIDHIMGVLYAKDLLAHLHEETNSRSIRGLQREAYYVPETKPVSVLLQELQNKKVHIAIVVDEFGGTAGLVTIEDILEEIVGEIQDEHDPDEFWMQYISDDEYIFSARMDLDDINDLMGINLPTEESDTLGGLVYDTLGRVPEIGDVLDLDDLHLTVLNVEGRRIVTVKIERIPQDEEDNHSPKESVASDKPTSSLVGNAVSKST